MQITTHSPEETEAAGATYAQALRMGDCIALSGDLGAGKTAFARGVLRGLGHTGRVTSPTFAIANEYQTPRGAIAHLDLYRLPDREALYDMGFEEYLDGRRIVLIEWSEHAADLLPASCKRVCITYGATEQERILTLAEPEDDTGEDSKVEETSEASEIGKTGEGSGSGREGKGDKSA